MLRRVLTEKQAVCGEHVPWYFGFAYGDLRSGDKTYYIVPFNQIVALVRRIWFRLSRAKRDELDIARTKLASLEVRADEAEFYRDKLRIANEDIARLKCELYDVKNRRPQREPPFDVNIR